MVVVVIDDTETSWEIEDNWICAYKIISVLLEILREIVELEKAL